MAAAFGGAFSGGQLARAMSVGGLSEKKVSFGGGNAQPSSPLSKKK